MGEALVVAVAVRHLWCRLHEGAGSCPALGLKSAHNRQGYWEPGASERPAAGSAGGAGTGTLVEPTPQVSNGDGDHERFAHYVQKDKIMASALEDILTPWAGLAGEPDVVFQGGPVSLDSALGVAVIPGDEGPLGWRRVYGAIGLVDLEAPPELLAAALGSLR
ncbi:DUF3039 domain-containing protein [Streptomyces sp. sk2.1]|uniref:DUF3039 domain-containing protein n=1 Tax=Streptomyces sp. sk2.1 TaxID=2478959 RepID=UPI0037DC1B5D